MMTLNRAIRLAQQWASGRVCSLREGEAQEYHKMALAAFRAQQEAEKNDPLTMDELREMDGEPVWIRAAYYGVYADIVHIVGKEDGERFVRFKLNYRLQENGCGKTWLAYRRKPKEES